MCPITRLIPQKSDGPVPRGLKRNGPVLFSYGFRPFFLGGGLYAAIAIVVWLAALSIGLQPGGSYGASHWHAHEMLFGFAPAVLAGFLLTAIPNWTGRLPVSGVPLIFLFGLWLAGRLVMVDPDSIGLPEAIAVDGAFLPAMLLLALREIIAGRKWKDMKILTGLGILSAANILFHIDMLNGDHPATPERLAISGYVLLVMIIGGRIVSSFTRNYMAKQGRCDAPAPFGRFDGLAIVSGAVALSAWSLAPDSPWIAGPATLAAMLHGLRLLRWKGAAVYREPLLFVLHASYLFVPFGLTAIALGALAMVDETFVLHMLTIGVISTMMLAVMTRATRGHTGRALSASSLTSLSYGLLFVAAVTRPLASLADAWQMPLLYLSGASFALAFLLFGLEHMPMLLLKRRKASGDP